MIKSKKHNLKPPEVTFDEPESDPEEEDAEAEDAEGEEIDFGEGLDLAALVQTFFTNDNGENVADIMTSIRDALAQQNKILMKLGALLTKEKK